MNRRFSNLAICILGGAFLTLPVNQMKASASPIKNMYVVNTARQDYSGRVYQVDESELWILELRQNGNALTGNLLKRVNLKNRFNSGCLEHNISGYVDDNKVTLLFTSVEENCCKGARMQFEGFIDESGIVNGKRYPVGDVPPNCTLAYGAFQISPSRQDSQPNITTPSNNVTPSNSVTPSNIYQMQRLFRNTFIP